MLDLTPTVLNLKSINIHFILGSVWDKLDISLELCFILGFILKSVEHKFQISDLNTITTDCNAISNRLDGCSDSCFIINTSVHILYGLSFYLLLLRSTHALILHRTLGPQVSFIAEFIGYS